MEKKIELKVVGLVHHKLFQKLEDVLGNYNKKNAIPVFCDFAMFDIPSGYVFNLIVDKKGKIVYTGTFFLNKITQQFAKPFDSIPHGWKTICLFQFTEEDVPEVIYQLPYTEDWYQSDNFIYFK